MAEGYNLADKSFEVGETPSHILVADDHALFADALKSLVQLNWPMCQISHVADASMLLEQLACSDQFDAVLLDLRMPGMENSDSVGKIVDAAGERPVILMSGLATASEISAAMRSGVAGFMPKHGSGEELMNTLSDILIHKVPAKKELDLSSVTEDAVISRLSRRELETALHMARGLSNKEIALHLEISPETVKVYTKSIMTKFSVRNRTEFAVEAIRRGLA